MNGDVSYAETINTVVRMQHFYTRLQKTYFWENDTHQLQDDAPIEQLAAYKAKLADAEQSLQAANLKLRQVEDEQRAQVSHTLYPKTNLPMSLSLKF